MSGSSIANLLYSAKYMIPSYDQLFLFLLSLQHDEGITIMSLANDPPARCLSAETSGNERVAFAAVALAFFQANTCRELQDVEGRARGVESAKRAGELVGVGENRTRRSRS